MENRNWNFTILQLCEEINISIPRFCYYRELSIVGNCRMCMVELKSSIKPVIACATLFIKKIRICVKISILFNALLINNVKFIERNG